MTESAVQMPDQEQDESRRCNGTNRHGERCTVPPEMLLWDENTAAWYCVSHHVDPAIREARLAGAMRGSMRSGMRRMRMRRLDPGELGALQTVEDAQRQLSLLAEAVSTGRLSSADANAASRLIGSWIRARDLLIKEGSLRALQQQVDELRRERKAALR